MLKVVIPCFNAENYIESCISSLKQQTEKNFEAIIVDDASTDLTPEKAIDAIKKDSRFKLVRRTENKGQLSSIINGTKALNPGENDVIVNVDGDDYLYLKTALEIINHTYQRTDCLMTYGSFKTQSGNIRMPGQGRRYTQNIINKCLYRKAEWLASHLRTYKYSLWNKINKEDFKDEDGEYWRAAGDMAMMFPMLEMAGDRQEAVSDIIYCYRDNISTNIHAIRKDEQRRNAIKIREKLSYTRI